MTDNSRLKSNNRPFSIDCSFDLGSNDKLFGYGKRMKSSFAYGEYATCCQQHGVCKYEKKKAKFYLCAFYLSVVITEKVA